MAQVRVSNAAAVLFLLFSSNVAYAVRHNGKSHVHRNEPGLDLAIKARQENGAGLGIGALQEASLSQGLTSTEETVSALVDPYFDPASSTAGSILNTPFTTGITVVAASITSSPSPSASVLFQTTFLPVTSSYAFPTTVLQIPVATVCPDTPATSAVFTLVPVSSVVLNTSLTNSSFSYSIDTASTAGPAPLAINATAILANGSSTVFLSYIIPTSTVPDGANTTASVLSTADASATTSSPDAVARILLGSDGCQTIYTPLTTALCSTVVTLAGMATVSITECGQYVTFSSNVLAAICEPTTTATSTSTAPLITSSAVAQKGIPDIVYYAAHWLDLTKGEVPSIVKVASCSSGNATTACSTGSESWSVSMATTTMTTTSAIGYSGPAILAQSTQDLTTYISFNTTTTFTQTKTYPTVIRQKMVEPATYDGNRTVTVQVTMPTTQTYSLQGGSTSAISYTSISTSVVTVEGTSTVTMQSTITATLTVAPTVAVR